MPWKIEKRDDKWCVVKENDGTTVHCHDSEDSANEQLKAFYASENKELAERADTAEKALVERVWDAVQARLKGVLPQPEQQPVIGFTVYKDAAGGARWLAIYSNNFEDREREIFSEKGFDRFVARLDMGVVPMPRLRTWHVPGSEYGTADWVDRIGHFFVATGTYDDSDAGRAGAAYDEKHWKEYGVSHGLLYRASDKQVIDGRAVYGDWNTFEISPLPYRRAANDLTAFAVNADEQEKALKEAEMDQEKRKHLVEKFGEDYVAKLEAATEARGKEIEALRAYKDFVHPDGGGEVEANKEALDAADKAFGDLMPDLVADAGEAVAASLAAVKAVTAQNETITALRAEFQQALAQLNQRFDDAPRRASKDIATRLRKDDPAATLLDKSIEQEKMEGGILAGMFKNGNAES